MPLTPLTSWSLDEPAVIGGLVVGATLYAVGARRLKRRARAPVAGPWRAWSYFLGLAAIVLALLSPIDVYAEKWLFLHMIQHLLLLLVAPPLIWLGAPFVPMLWAFPRRLRRKIGRLLHPSHPVHHLFHRLTDARVALALFVTTVGLWHLPWLYDRAQGVTLAHDAEHVCFLVAGMLFWWPVVHPGGGRRRLTYGWAISYLFVASIEGFVIGAALIFGQHPVYGYYARQAAGQAATSSALAVAQALADQRLAGLTMWLPGGLLWATAMTIVFVRWMGSDQALEAKMMLYLEGLNRR